MHGFKEGDFYKNQEEKEAFQKKLSKGYEILDNFILSFNKLKNTEISNVYDDPNIQKLLELSGVLLGFIGELAPSWAFRRWYISQLVNQDPPLEVLESSIKKELNLLTNVMLKSTKFQSSWQHRLLIISKFAPKLSLQIYNSLLNDELVFVDKILVLDGRNFHCWRYIKYLRHIMKDMVFPNSLTYPEYLTHLIKEDISNFSAYHERLALPEFNVKEELEFLREAIYTDPEDSSIWAYYKQALVRENKAELLKICADKGQATYLYFSKPVRQPILSNGNSAKWSALEGKDSGISRVWKLHGTLSPRIDLTIPLASGIDGEDFYRNLVSPGGKKAATTPITINVGENNNPLDYTMLANELKFVEELLAIEPDSIYLHIAKIFILKLITEDSSRIIACYDKLIELDPLRANYYKYKKLLLGLKDKLKDNSEYVDISANRLSGFSYDMSVSIIGCTHLNLSSCELTSKEVIGWSIPLIFTLEILNLSNNKLDSLDTLATNVEL